MLVRKSGCLVRGVNEEVCVWYHLHDHLDQRFSNVVHFVEIAAGKMLPVCPYISPTSTMAYFIAMKTIIWHIIRHCWADVSCPFFSVMGSTFSTQTRFQLRIITMLWMMRWVFAKWKLGFNYGVSNSSVVSGKQQVWYRASATRCCYPSLKQKWIDLVDLLSRFLPWNFVHDSLVWKKTIQFSMGDNRC